MRKKLIFTPVIIIAMIAVTDTNYSRNDDNHNNQTLLRFYDDALDVFQQVNVAQLGLCF